MTKDQWRAEGREVEGFYYLKLNSASMTDSVCRLSKYHWHDDIKDQGKVVDIVSNVRKCFDLVNPDTSTPTTQAYRSIVTIT